MNQRHNTNEETRWNIVTLLEPKWPASGHLLKTIKSTHAWVAFDHWVYFGIMTSR